MRIFPLANPISPTRWYRKVDARELAHINKLKGQGAQYRPVSYDGLIPHRTEFSAGSYIHAPAEREYLVTPGGAMFSVEMSEAENMGEEGTGIRPIVPYSELCEGIVPDGMFGAWGSLNRKGIPSILLRLEVEFPLDVLSGSNWGTVFSMDLESGEIG